MTPSSFTFKLSVPRDPSLAVVVADLAAHAAKYAEMAAAAGKAFVGSVSEATAEELGVGDGANCPIVLVSADGELTLTIGERTISQKTSG